MNSIIAKPNQTIVDLCLVATGGVNYLQDFCELNNCAADDEAVVGQTYYYDYIENADIAAALQDNQPATVASAATQTPTPISKLYAAGDGISISNGNIISAKIDNNTLQVDSQGRLYVTSSSTSPIVEAVEQNIGNINTLSTILGRATGETMSELLAKYQNNTAPYNTLYSFVQHIKAFLEDSDASMATINRWHEIESFLAGITDSETLAGLLQNLETTCKDYADTQDATTLQAAKNYTDAQSVSSLFAWTTRTISNTGRYPTSSGTATFTAKATVIENTYFADIKFNLITTGTSAMPIQQTFIDLGFQILQTFYSDTFTARPEGLIGIDTNGKICSSNGITSTANQPQNFHFFVAKKIS